MNFTPLSLSLSCSLVFRIECQERQINIEWSRYVNSEQRGVNQSVDAAYSLFRTSFGKIELEDKRDMIRLVTYSHEDPDDYGNFAVDFSSFFVVVLRKGPSIVSAAVLRVRGQRFAELPFITTRPSSRGEGNCRRLVSAVERRLISLGVRHLIIPSLESAMGMWTKFGYNPLSQQELEYLGTSILQMDPESSRFLKRRLDIPIAQESQRVPMMPLDGKRVRVKSASSLSLAELDYDDDEDDGEGSRGSRSESESEGSQKGKKARHSKRQKVTDVPAKKIAIGAKASSSHHHRGGGYGAKVKVKVNGSGNKSSAIASNENSAKKPPKGPSSRALSSSLERPKTSLSFLKPSIASVDEHVAASALHLLIEGWLFNSDLDIVDHLILDDYESDSLYDYSSPDLDQDAPGNLSSPLSPIHQTIDKTEILKPSMNGSKPEVGVIISPTRHTVTKTTIKLLPCHAYSSHLPMERFQSQVMDALLPSVVHCLFITPSPDPATPLTSLSTLNLPSEDLQLSRKSPDQDALLTAGLSLIMPMDEPISVEESLAIAAQYAYSLDDDQSELP